MTSPAEQMKHALLEIRRLRRELANRDHTDRQSGPIAIIGTGLRLPGGISDLAGFEALLANASHVVTEVPASRWNRGDVPVDLTSSAFYGAFLDQVDMFDPEFFGISGTEAASMDPQQRLVLETGWEALENAGYAPDSFADKSLGIFLGMANSDYGRSLLHDMPAIDPYFTSGSSFSVASGRLAYFLGTKGPAITLDTACSSSLVAIHLACKALKSGECDVALAGGVNLILSPEVHVNFSRANMLATDGLCKTFDASADGYVRGEGCIMFTLRRLSDAQADGDPILAIIRGSAINQDGRSNGLTAPNGPSQESLIRDALEDAGVDAMSVGYIEAHGTGTPLGDPIEVSALAKAYDRDHENAPPLLVGSVKTNLGHLESAAGAAGILKSIVALRSGRIPAHLNFETPNPHIDWQSMSLSVPLEAQAWPLSDPPRRAGVSSFGFSGTNAHIILDEAPPVKEQASLPDSASALFTLSARSPSALSTLASRTASVIANSSSPLSDLCLTATDGRAHFQYRLAVSARDKAELFEALQAASESHTHASYITGRAVPGRRTKVAFLFTGQGAQYSRMGQELYETYPIYKDAIDTCSEILGNAIPGGLRAALTAGPGDSRIHEPSIAQPALFSHEYALAKLWISFGIIPHAVCGHSLGEFVAATVSGVLPLEGALGLVAERGRLTAEAANGGMMASVFASKERIEPYLAKQASLEIAAYNGPNNHVLSGPATTLEPLLAQMSSDGIRTEPLKIAFAAHCMLVEPIMERFRSAAQKIQFGKASIPIVSNLDGDFTTTDEIATPDHWVSHLRQPVKFADGVRTLIESGITHFIEIGPHPVLSAMALDTRENTDPLRQPAFLASLRRDGEPGLELTSSLARLYVDGVQMDPACQSRIRGKQRAELPTYPFERTRHWHPSAPRAGWSERHKTDASWRKLCARLDRESERGPLGFNAATYPQKWETLAALRRALVITLLIEAGLFTKDGESHSLDELLRKLRATDALAPLVSRWLHALEDSGDLNIVSTRIMAPRALADPELANVRTDVQAALADNTPLCDYVLHCANLLGPVLRGEASPLETLFPGGDFSLALGLYERSETMRYMNGLAAAAFESLIGTKASLSILEAGAGTGGTTTSVLDALRDEHFNYRFTDVSDLFLDHARERFADREGISYHRFDLESDPAAQGFPAGTFDIVLASNAVHAVRDLPSTLAHLRSLLRPSGILILVESTTHFAWFDVTTGLIEGWRHAEDDLRDDLALIDANKWQSALLDSGFEIADAWPRSGSSAESVGQHLIVARAPSSASFVTSEMIIATPQFVETPPLATDPQITSLLDAIAEALPNERKKVICNLVRTRVEILLRRRGDQPPSDEDRLRELGMDSLMAVQLRNTLSRDLDIQGGLPTTLFLDYPTIAAVSEFLTGALGLQTAPILQAETAYDTSDKSKIDITHMSDEEVEAILLERLNR
ncbi:MAG: acyltransferase domain-containing protein [Alphaproteobacteria bacterium]|nr:acyltransferase domain-containing protein [Alphaproteobacteria bacterium]MBU2144484.1 acyltransferase domain-containing protein [Alphaproteobacteria bacterium]MBU2195501.1 acyltransferase domain-containing protein [Alphaproteobacteria bacterium]